MPHCFIINPPMHTHTHTHTYTHTHTCTHTCTHSHTHVCTLTHMYTCTHAHTHIYTHMHTCSTARLDTLRFCPALPHPPVNGYLCTPPSSTPGMVQFCCNKGFSLSGNSVASCNLDIGRWEPDTPNCLRRSHTFVGVPAL